MASTTLRCFSLLLRFFWSAFVFASLYLLRLMHSQNECAAKRLRCWKMFKFQNWKNALHFSLDPVYFMLAISLSISSGHSCFFSRFYLVSFGWLLFIYWTENEIFVNCSHLENVFIFVVVAVAVVFFTGDFRMALCVRDATMFKYLSIKITFQNEAHILSWTVGNHVTVAHDTEICFVNHGVAAAVFFCECVSARSVFRRQFEALWSAPIEVFGSIYIMSLSVESQPSEVASIHSKCNKRMRLRFWWAFQICSRCSHRNCPYFISDRVAEVDFV